MDKPWSCGTIFAAAVLLVIWLMVLGVIDLNGETDTANAIVATKRACEAQTGQPC